MALKDANALVVLTVDQVRGLMAEVFRDELAKAAPPDQSDVLDMDHAAALVGVTVKTMRKLVKEDGLPTLRRIGKLWRFSRRDVLAWLARRKSA